MTLEQKQLLVRVVNQIIEHPETWDQSAVANECKTKFCLLGHLRQMAGNESRDPKLVAREVLGISHSEAYWLFSPERTLSDFHRYATMAITDEKYDRAGYDRAGYDRYGYDRYGYDRAGYDRAGYERAGYDRYGYDRAGYDRAGKRIQSIPMPTQ